MQTLPALPSSGITLILAPRAVRRNFMTLLTAQLALPGPLQILDGGNSFNGLKLTRELRRQTRRYHAALQGVTIARAFTCYQMETLLGEMPRVQSPMLVLELLATFYDENIPAHERQRLLNSCLARLEPTPGQGPLFVSAEPGDDTFTTTLKGIADSHWCFEIPAPIIQARLF